ncbi:hypothetical protein CN984_12585 [Bacillus cereus]|uniref:Uncharacterized protein n=1 Tax=Bacillus cereus TaxID=1396 RepID=A0A2A7FNJ2_BACCE|nr:hypothetical protein [Bacillus cereus]PEA25904.1 hypothetical protein CON44_18370 [Bacillus cereus]PGO29254.1 hypothetical protein CN984_12585 [Bacillus cereus]
MDAKKLARLQKIVALHNDSYERYLNSSLMDEVGDMEWKACYEQGLKLIMREIGEMEEARLVAVNIFYLFVEKKSWFTIPNRDARGEHFRGLFVKGLDKLGIKYHATGYSYDCMEFTL